MGFFDSSGATAAGGIVTSVVGGLFGNRQNKRNNRTQLKINQMNNEFNEREAQKARDFNERMYLEDREYNEPLNQMNRKLEAGINPYLDSGGAGSITAGGSNPPSASPASSAGMAQTHAFDWTPTIQGVSKAISDYYVNDRLRKETEGIGIRNSLDQQFGSDMMRSKIASLLGGDYSQITPEYRSASESYKAFGAHLGMQSRVQEFKNLQTIREMNTAQTAFTLLRGEEQGILNKYLDANQQADLVIKAASLQNMRKEGLLKDQDLKQRIASTLETYARIKGLKIANRVALNTADSVIRATNMANKHSWKQHYYSMKQVESEIDANISAFKRQIAENDEITRRKKGKFYNSDVHDFLGETGDLLRLINPFRSFMGK